jgi:hypothetical protein
MTTSHSDSVAVVRHHSVQLIDTSDERSAIGLRRPNPVIRQRQYRDRLLCTGKYIDALMSVFQWQVDERLTSDASSSGHEHPDIPRLVQATTSASESILILQMMSRIVRCELLGSG